MFLEQGILLDNVFNNLIESSSVIVYVLMIIGIVVFAGVFYLFKKRKSSKSKETTNSKPLAYFPAVEEGEKKHTYY